METPRSVIFLLIVQICLPESSNELENLSKSIDLKPNAPKSLQNNEPTMTFLSELEESAFLAVKFLHEQMDDDRSGSVDLSESDEYIREELDNRNGGSRQKNFHNNDYQISVEELWDTFKKSSVYNWTVDDVGAWLGTHINLPNYESLFREKSITGLHLTLLAANQDHYFTKTLGRLPPDVKRKIIIKATDVVIFGPPANTHDTLKDILLGVLILFASVCAWFADNQSKKSKRDLSKLQTKMEYLTKTETDLRELQEHLKSDEKKKIELELSREKDAKEKENLMEEIKRVKLEADKLKLLRLKSDEKADGLRLAEEELEQVRKALKGAEQELRSADDRLWVAPVELQKLLQKTYKQETKNHALKRLAAEKQLAEAKEFCEKVRKKRDSVLTLMSMPHRDLMDKIDKRIFDAKSALEEVGDDLRERRQRWQQIEMLCGVSIQVDTPSVLPPSASFVKSLDKIDEQEASMGDSDSGSVSDYGSKRSIPKKRSVTSLTDLEGVNRPSFFLERSSADVRHLQDNLFQRSSTLPKGHPRFAAINDQSISRSNSETALSRDCDAADEDADEGDHGNDSTSDESSETSKQSTPELDNLRTSGEEAGCSSKRNKLKAKKLFSKFLSREKLAELSNEESSGGAKSGKSAGK